MIEMLTARSVIMLRAAGDLAIIRRYIRTIYTPTNFHYFLQGSITYQRRPAPILLVRALLSTASMRLTPGHGDQQSLFEREK